MVKASWVGLASVLLGAAVAVAQPPEEMRESMDLLISGSAPAKPSAYWLGIEVAPVPAALRSQLNLPEKQGMLVATIVPDSPAAKAGIQRYDVLLQAAGKPLHEPRELVAAIELVKNAALKLDVIHNGKAKTVEATPVRRSEDARRDVLIPSSGDWDTMQKWLERGWSGDGGEGPPVQFHVVHPGAIVPRDAVPSTPLPENMSVVISKQGDRPASIVVTRDKEKWEVTEKQLDKLPADVRPHVERLLGRGAFGVIAGLRPSDFLPELAVPNERSELPNGPAASASPRDSDPMDRLEKRFDEMDRRIERILRQMEAAQQPKQPNGK